MDMNITTGLQKPRWITYFFISINGFALTLRAQVLSGLVVPLMVLDFAGEAQKGSYYGSIRLWGLMVALLAQTLVGLLSDHSRLKWGRRRPFIFAATIVEVFVLGSFIWIARLEGMRGYTFLFGAYLLYMILSNTSHAATQGFIPDIIPQKKRGIASGVKLLLEAPLPLVVVAMLISPMISKGNLNEAIVITGAIMLGCMLLSMFVREKPLETHPIPLNWKPFFSLLLMTAVFTGVILGLGETVKWIIRVTGETTRLIYGIIGVGAMLLAVVIGVFASLAVHLDASIRKNTSFTWMIISRLAAFVAINNMASFLLYFFEEKFAIPSREAIAYAGKLPMVLGGFVLLFGILAGWLCDRFDRKVLMVLSGITGAIGVTVLLLGKDLNMVFVAAVIIGLGYALFHVSSWALSADIVPPDRAGEFLGLQNLAGAGAGAIGAYIGGTIADHAGYVLMMGMFGVMFMAAALAAVFIRVKKVSSE